MDIEAPAGTPLEPTGDTPLEVISGFAPFAQPGEQPTGSADIYEVPSTGETITVPAALFIESGEATKGWTATRKDGIETFTTPDNITYVRARPDEGADVIVGFARLRGMTPLRLVLASESATVKRAERRKRRELRELRKRGYDV